MPKKFEPPKIKKFPIGSIKKKKFNQMSNHIKKSVFLPPISQAEVAQLVEHNLAKVGVASSSLVFRSTKKRRKFASLFLSFFIAFYRLSSSPSRSPCIPVLPYAGNSDTDSTMRFATPGQTVAAAPLQRFPRICLWNAGS